MRLGTQLCRNRRIFNIMIPRLSLGNWEFDCLSSLLSPPLKPRCRLVNTSLIFRVIANISLCSPFSSKPRPDSRNHVSLIQPSRCLRPEGSRDRRKGSSTSLAASALCGSANMSTIIVGSVFLGVTGNGMYCGVLTPLTAYTEERERPGYLPAARDAPSRCREVPKFCCGDFCAAS